MNGQYLWAHYQTDPNAIINRLRNSGARGILLKYADGNSVVDNTPFNYQTAFRALVGPLKAAGFDVAAWSYIYPGDTIGSIVAQAEADGASFYVLDAEGEFDNPSSDSQAKAILNDITAKTKIHLGYAPFPYCYDHPQYPYAVFDSVCKVAMPQIYWCDLGDSVDDAYNNCWEAFVAQGLIGSSHALWQPIGQTDNNATVFDVQHFAAICKGNGQQPVPGISWWVVDDQPTALDAALANGAYAAPKEPSVAQLQAQVKSLEARIAAAQKDLA